MSERQGARGQEGQREDVQRDAEEGTDTETEKGGTQRERQKLERVRQREGERRAWALGALGQHRSWLHMASTLSRGSHTERRGAVTLGSGQTGEGQRRLLCRRKAAGAD